MASILSNQYYDFSQLYQLNTVNKKLNYLRQIYKEFKKSQNEFLKPLVVFQISWALPSKKVLNEIKSFVDDDHVLEICKVAGVDDLLGSTALAEDQLALTDVLRALKPVLENPAVLKIGQNMKYDAKIFARYGITVAPIDDTMLISYALHGGLHSHGMDTLSERYLSHKTIPIKPLLGSGKSAITFDKVSISDATPYAAEDADVTLRLWQTLKPRLHRARVTRVYETLERPLVPILAEMEMTGIKVDRDTLSRMSNTFAQKMLNWVPKISFKSMISEMVQNDLKSLD